MAEVKGVNHHVNVGAVLPAHLGARDVDHLDAVAVKLAHFIAVLTPVAIRALIDDAPFFEQTLEDQADLKGAHFFVTHTEGEVFIVHENRNQFFICHLDSQWFGATRNGSSPSVYCVLVREAST